jgi:hypothetical protein
MCTLFSQYISELIFEQETFRPHGLTTTYLHRAKISKNWQNILLIYDQKYPDELIYIFSKFPTIFPVLLVK